MDGQSDAAQRELTYGEKAVGLTFNPSGDTKVFDIKKTRVNLFQVAIVEAQAAQMWAVKAVTWKD